MTLRIHRGFHRIGIVLAVPVALVALVMACHEAAYPTGHLAPGPDGTPYHPSDYLEPALWAILAFALYAGASAIGWVIEGLMGADQV